MEIRGREIERGDKLPGDDRPQVVADVDRQLSGCRKIHVRILNSHQVFCFEPDGLVEVIR
jgi:hypothetical protein